MDLVESGSRVGRRSSAAGIARKRRGGGQTGTSRCFAPLAGLTFADFHDPLHAV